MAQVPWILYLTSFYSLSFFYTWNVTQSSVYYNMHVLFTTHVLCSLCQVPVCTSLNLSGFPRTEAPVHQTRSLGSTSSYFTFSIFYKRQEASMSSFDSPNTHSRQHVIIFRFFKFYKRKEAFTFRFKVEPLVLHLYGRPAISNEPTARQSGWLPSLRHDYPLTKTAPYVKISIPVITPYCRFNL